MSAGSVALAATHWAIELYCLITVASIVWFAWAAWFTRDRTPRVPLDVDLDEMRARVTEIERAASMRRHPTRRVQR